MWITCPGRGEADAGVAFWSSSKPGPPGFPPPCHGRRSAAPLEASCAEVRLGGLADACGRLCAALNLPDGARRTATLSASTTLLRVREGPVTAASTALHVGWTTIVVETELSNGPVASSPRRRRYRPSCGEHSEQRQGGRTMRVRWLGWAGVEIEAGGEGIVIDALNDVSALLAPFGEHARDVPCPAITEPAVEQRAATGLLTHLHRDHADAGALAHALRPGAPVLGPASGGEEGLDELGLAQAASELERAGLTVTAMHPWEERSVGPFRITAVPAVDGLGDPQVSWVVEGDGRRVIHLGDTMFHGFWWRIAHRLGPFDVAFVPVNGAVTDYPHRQPASGLPAVMTPEQAAAAGDALQARMGVPMHFGAYDFEPYYRPIDDAAAEFVRHATARSFTPRTLAVGEALDLAALEPVAEGSVEAG